MGTLCYVNIVKKVGVSDTIGTSQIFSQGIAAIMHFKRVLLAIHILTFVTEVLLNCLFVSLHACHELYEPYYTF